MTNAELLAELEVYRAELVIARAAILKGQKYSISGHSSSRMVERPTFQDVVDEIRRVTADMRTLEGGNKIRVQRVVPRDI
jgi:hypothetical protein